MSQSPSEQQKSLSPAQARVLKQKLRSLRWQPEAVMREVELIQKLRWLARGKD